MLCTECSKPVKPIVTIDIDGTIAEYHLRLAQFACDYHDRPLPRKPWDGIGNYESFLGMTQAEYREAKLAYRQGGYKRTAPLLPFAQEMMAILRNHFDLEIWIATTRPWSRLDSVDPDTKFWLQRHGITYDHILFDDNKYAKLASIVDPNRVIMVLDDLPEMLSEAQTHLPNAHRLLVNRPHNVHAGNARVSEFYSGWSAVSLTDVPGLVSSYIIRWNERVA